MNTTSVIRSAISHHDNYESSNESALLDWMLQQLSVEELETAARSSYQYLVRSVSSRQHGAGPIMDVMNAGGDEDLDNARMRQARAMARRYLRANKCNNHKVALCKMKDTLAFRKQYDLDALRLCFSTYSTLIDNEIEANSEINIPSRTAGFRQQLVESMVQKEIFVQGFDRDGRALWIGVPRRTRSFEDEAYIRDAVYTLERAIACSELNHQDQVTAVLDYSAYNPLLHNPPLHLSKRVLSTLRNHYVGRLHRICLVNVPWTMRMIWKVLSPFAGTDTRHKLIFVADRFTEKQGLLVPLVDPSQVPSWVLPNGELSSDHVDVQRFLTGIPFDRPYTSN